jgi:hypothetical protein
LPDRAQTATPKTTVILHSFAVTVEQLCARSAGAPSIEDLRFNHFVFRGQPAWNAARGTLQIVGHGMYSRQVRGLTQKAWIVIWVLRFLCLMCGHRMNRFPDWLHPWRWYAGTVIIEALLRRCILMESEISIAVLFGRPQDSTEWKSLRRWRTQLLISSTLWGCLYLRKCRDQLTLSAEHRSAPALGPLQLQLAHSSSPDDGILRADKRRSSAFRIGQERLSSRPYRPLDGLLQKNPPRLLFGCFFRC